MLAYNPAMELYRPRTPDLRTEWEKDHLPLSCFAAGDSLPREASAGDFSLATLG